MAPPILKRDASPDMISDVKKIEEQSDKWAGDLALADFTHDVAAWGTLTQIINLIEQQIQRYSHGSQEQLEAMINLGRAAALLIAWLRGAQLPIKEVLLRWTLDLREATQGAVFAAHNYETFVSCLSMWHKDRMMAEMLSPTHIRLSILPSVMDRRIRAHQQGVRIPGWPSTTDNPVGKSFVDDQNVNQLLARLWNKVTLEGALAMQYPDDDELLAALTQIYEDRLRLAFRRNPLLDLGGYNLEVFRRFFAGLLSVCSVHEYLCAAWFKARGRFPFESAVIVRPVADWVNLIVRLCGIVDSQVRQIVSDLTFGTIRPLDIYIHPFVPSFDGKTLFLVPHFILNSRAEENILRVCSYARPQYYSPIANAKEGEMRELIKASAPTRYRITGPLKLPGPHLPDIDLVIKDRETSDVLIGELKWLRKTVRVLEHLDRDAEVEEGFRQLRQIRTFLEEYPKYLRERGGIASHVDPLNLSYAVIARDHLAHIPPQDGLWLTEFDALIWALQNSDGLADALQKLKTHEWLPVEGRDFTVRFEASSVAGVTIDAEIFHRPGPH